MEPEPDPSLEAIAAAKRDASETVSGTDATVGDFWQWAYSDLLTNSSRGVLAEYLVALAVGADDNPRDPWATYDLVAADGTTIEVKSAAYVQSWRQKRLSKIVLPCRPTRALDPELNDYVGESKRQADVYVLAVLEHTDVATLNPLDTEQWRFYVVPTAYLDEHFPTAQSVSLTTLLRSPHGAAYEFGELARAIESRGGARP